MRRAVIISAVRTPVCKLGGAFKTLEREDLYVPVVKEAIARAHVDEKDIDGAVWGDVAQYYNPAKFAALQSGLPSNLSGMSMTRGCGTGLTGLSVASVMIEQGWGDCYLVGGVEMDSVRYYSLHNDDPYNNGTPYIDTKLSSPVVPFGNPPMVKTAENVAAKYGITREQCDEYGARSQRLAALGYEEGIYPEHILPITVPQRKGDPVVVTKDEMLRPSTVETLAKLKPVMGGVVTAGNASPLNDGAAAAIVMEEEKAKALGLKPLLRFVDFATVGVDPRYMGLGPVGAMNKLFKRNKMTIDDLDFVECNEAFASQTLGVNLFLKIPMEKLNIRGGGIALGHPYSATGINLAAKSAGIFKHLGGERCAITFCCGGGQGVAALFENCQ